MKQLLNCILFVILVILVPFEAHAQTKVKITPEIIDLSTVGDSFDVKVLVEDVYDLAGFEFSIDYPAFLSVETGDIVMGDFLGSTGRNVSPLGPTISVEKLNYGAFTFGADFGPNGDGILATITFTVKSQSNGTLKFSKANLMNSKGRVISATSSGAKVRCSTCTEYHTITFTAGTGGSIEGLKNQSIESGGNATAVNAVPNTCYTFAGWSGDYIGTENPLTLLNITQDMKITANFESLYGDVNEDEIVDLKDAILALKLLCGIRMTEDIIITNCSDVNNDGKLGFEEVVYILQKLGKMR